MFKFIHQTQSDFEKKTYRIVSLLFFLMGTTIFGMLINQYWSNSKWLSSLFSWFGIGAYYTSFFYWRYSTRKVYTLITHKQIETNYQLIKTKLLVVPWNQVVSIEMKKYPSIENGYDIVIDLAYVTDTFQVKNYYMKQSFYGLDKFIQLIQVIKTKKHEVPFNEQFEETERFLLKTWK